MDFNKIIIVYGFIEKPQKSNESTVVFPISYTTYYVIVSNVITQKYQYSVSAIISHDLNGCTFSQAQSTNGTSYPINYVCIGY